MKDGDHPDTIVVTYNRCNAAAEMVEDLIRIFPPRQWLTLSVQMLDRDLLADDEWWGALQRRRWRKLRRGGTPDLPSYSTRVTAGHQLAVASTAWISTDTHPGSPVTAPKREHEWSMASARKEAWKRAHGVCQAAGQHHRLCPHDITTENVREFIPHHIFTREQAKRLKIPQTRVDVPDNLIIVWNGRTGKGTGGCHGRIHNERTSARALGLLAAKGSTNI